MDRSINIAHVVWTLQLAGAEKIAYDLLCEAKASGFRSVVCSLTPSNPESRQQWIDAGIRVQSFTKSGGVDLRLPYRLRRFLQQNDIGILHTHNAVGGLYGGWAARALPTRHVHTEHSNLAGHQRLLRSATRFFLRRARIVADSKKVAVIMERRDRFHPDRIEIIYNGVATEMNGEVSKSAVRGTLGIPETTTLIGTVGNLRPVKDHRTLIRAFAGLAPEFPDVHLGIVGEGSERDRLSDEIARCSLQTRVHLLGYRNNVGEILRTFDLFVLSSRSEGLPLSLLEAMAARLPVVSTSVGGIPEVVNDSQNGLLVPYGSPKGLARAISQMLRNPEQARAMGRAGRETVLNRFSRKGMVQRYLELYEEVT